MKFKLPFLLIPIVLITSRITCSTIQSTNSSSSKNSTNELHASCTTQSCNDAVKSMTEGIDPTVNPCDNFYQFTCGSYVNSANSTGNIQNKKKEFDWIKQLSGKIEKELISSLEKDINRNDTEAVEFTKHLYQTCVNESAIEEQGLAPFLDMMEHVGGWPVLKENQTWNETAFNWNRVVFKIGNVENWNNILLPLTPIENSNNLTQLHIIVGESTNRIPVNVLRDGINDQKVQDYFKYMVDMAVSMGASESYATKELNQTLHFEIKLANITFAGKTNSDPNLYGTNYMNLLVKQIKISELMKNYSFIPWDEYIKHQLPSNVTIADVDDTVIVENLNYMNDLIDLIESTPKRVVANYIMWRNFDRFAEFLTKSIRDIRTNYENTININNTSNKSRSKQCFEYISSTMPLVLSIIYVREYFDKNTESNVNIILNNVQDEFVEMLKNASWMDEVTRNRSIDKAININRIIGYPKELLDDSITNKYSPGLQFIDNKYVENIHISLIYLRKSTWKIFNPITLNEITQWVLYGQIAWRPLGAFYNPNTNVLFAPAGSIQSPIYSYSLPMYMNYGKIGSALGHEIGHGFDADRRKFDKNNKIVDWLNATETKYNENAQCILTQYSNYSKKWVSWDTAKMIQNEDIADNIGIKAAYYAYNKLAHMDKNETIKGTVYTPQQMFWISYASVWCDMQRMDLFHSSSKDRVIGPLSNMKEFADDFNCPIDSPMNPSKKCQIL